MANGTLAPNPVFTGWDANGDPLPGGLLSTFAAGTSTPLATYSDVGLTTPNANPVVLDSAGRCVLFLSAASYKFVLKNSAGVTQWTQDNISAVPASQVNVDIDGVAGEALAAGDAIYLSSGAADGGRTAGQWYKADAAAPLRSTLATALGMAPNAITMSSTGSSRLSGRITGLAGLTAGVLYYVSSTTPGALTSVAPTNARAIATADSTTSVVMSQFIPVPNASATVAGIVSLGAQQLGSGAKTADSLVATGALTVGAASTLTLPPTFKPGTQTTNSAIVSGGLNCNVTAVTQSSASELDLITYTLKGNTLSANGKVVRVTASFRTNGGGGNRTIRFYYGATALSVGVWTAGSQEHKIIVEVIRTAASAEIVSAVNIGTDLSTTKSTAYAIDTTVDQTIKFTTQGAGAGDGTTEDYMLIEVVG